MTELFLKAKHWQLFLLFFGLPVVTQIIFMFIIMSSVVYQPDLDPQTMFDYMMKFMFFFIIIGVISSGAQLWWQWAIAVGLQSKLPEEVNMKVRNFKIFFWIPVVYFVVFFGVFFFIFIQMVNLQHELHPEMIVSIFFFVIPIHLFTMFCIFYVMYFAAKTIKTVELKRATRFSDFAGEFFLIWFYPIGVWFIQPKVNKWMEE